MKIKVCGITELAQLQQLQEMGIDYAGIILHEGSKRFAAKKLAGQEQKVKHSAIKKVGVFVNAEAQFIETAIDVFGLSAVQLHGNETPAFCRALQGKAAVIKAFPVNDRQNLDAVTAPFAQACDFYLFDTALPAASANKGFETFGGTGQQFNWCVLEQAAIGKQFFLSGGIGLNDVQKLSSFKHPYLYAADVNSRFETAPGVKDLQKVQQFKAALNHE